MSKPTYTKSDLTDGMLDIWMDEMRETFKDDPDNMNLIAIGLRVIDNQDEYKDNHELKAKWRESLLSFYQNSLTHNNQLVCEHCGNPMEVYYDVHCFHCDECKPKVEHSELNYFMCAKWLENKEPGFHQDKLWDDMCELELVQGNDTYMKLYDKYEGHKRYNALMKIWLRHFPVENIKYYVSW